jgi:hypothetical protein
MRIAGLLHNWQEAPVKQSFRRNCFTGPPARAGGRSGFPGIADLKQCFEGPLARGGADPRRRPPVPRSALGGPRHVPPSEKINIGYIGCGSQGLRQLMPALEHPGVRIVAVCDPNRKSRTYADFREMLEKEKSLDAVYVMTPDHLHGVIAVRAMQQGKHVVTHKPISNVLDEVRIVCETARQTGVATQLFCAADTQSTPMLCEWLAAGAIGPVREVHNWSTRPFWPQGMTELPAEKPPAASTGRLKTAAGKSRPTACRIRKLR